MNFGPRTAAFAHYLRSLVASWEALAGPQPGAKVVRGTDFIASRFATRHVYLNNAVVLAPAAVEPAERIYAAGEPYALWCLDDDRPTAFALIEHGYQHSETTRPMLRSLDTLPPASGTVIVDADRERFAELIGVPVDLLEGVAGLRTYASDGYDSGLVLQDFASDVYVSMVYTRPEARRQGLAVATLTAALLDARSRGAQTATLQATPMAERLYSRHGFVPVGRWQEWTRP